jgi:endonuclease YncB( thermonuclease family)
VTARLGGLLLLALLLLGCESPSGERAAAAARDEVVRVVDGDTVVLRSAGKSRLIGVDTPEVFGDQECFGREASAFARRLLRPGLRERFRELARRARERSAGLWSSRSCRGDPGRLVG